MFKSFRSQLVDQVVGGCMDFLCSCQAASKTASTMGYPGMKSCTVRGSQIVASHHIGQSYVVRDFICTFSFPHLFQQKEAIAETVATWISHMAAIEKQFSSSTSLKNFPRLRMVMIVKDYNYSFSSLLVCLPACLLNFGVRKEML